ncbi:hypothetical protein PA10_00197 [Pseudomonas phage pPa_SNUABM_DT01]|nr:hypothetical protein PA10_00197 [Pseudomonas phage pPa_SNUABM_DT01]
MKNNVSQESIGVLAGMAISTGAGLLVKYTPQIVAALSSKIGQQAAGAVIDQAKQTIADSIKNGKETDLVRFTQSARVEPILLMDKRAVQIPFIQDVVHTVFNMFTGYWLLAVSLDTKINGVSVGKRLDKFATDRDLNDATLTMLSDDFGIRPSTESLAFGLPFIDDIIAEQDATASMEADSDISAEELAALIGKALDEREQKDDSEAQKTLNKITDERLRDKLKREMDKVQKGTAKDATELAKKALDEWKQENAKNGGTGVTNAAKYVEKITNLAVGNVIDVTISEDGKEAVVPVTIRMRVAGMPSDTMVQTLAVGGTDVTFRSRWRAWRAGEIGFWSDFVLQMDRVDAHRAAMMKDETGYYKTVYARANRNSMAQNLAGGPSLATASAILVLDATTATNLERRIGGKLDNFKTRQGIFGHTYSMLMAVVDPDWESITIYTRGIEMPTKLRKDDIKTAGKSDSKEVMEILKSYQLGRAPGRI